jgi:hypothetical protein
MAPAPSGLLFGGFGIPARRAMSACGDAAFAKPGITNVTPIKHVARSASSLFMTDSLRLLFRIYPITVQSLACCDLVAECNGPIHVAQGLERVAFETAQRWALLLPILGLPTLFSTLGTVKKSEKVG